MRLIDLSLRSVSSSFVLLGVMVAGCAAGDAGEGSSEESGLALFKDPSTSGPRLDVYDFDGNAAITVGGPIGSEGVLGGVESGDSLVDIYRALHPTSTVPADLIALDQRIAPKLAALRNLPRRPVEAAPFIEKSESAFKSTVCKNFNEGTSRYTLKYCAWTGGPGEGITTNWAKPEIASGDRTYAWNNNPRTATLHWYKANSYTEVARNVLPANWWRWMSYTGGGGPFWGMLENIPYDGEYGITWHSLSYVVK